MDEESDWILQTKLKYSKPKRTSWCLMTFGEWIIPHILSGGADSEKSFYQKKSLSKYHLFLSEIFHHYWSSKKDLLVSISWVSALHGFIYSTSIFEHMLVYGWSVSKTLTLKHGLLWNLEEIIHSEVSTWLHADA